MKSPSDSGLLALPERLSAHFLQQECKSRRNQPRCQTQFQVGRKVRLESGAETTSDILLFVKTATFILNEKNNQGSMAAFFLSYQCVDSRRTFCLQEWLE